MPTCCAIGCSNRSKGGFHMYEFPTNPQRRKLWENRVGRVGWKPTNSSSLCQEHFDYDQFENGRAEGEKKLKDTAIPTIFSYWKSPKKRTSSIKACKVAGLQENNYCTSRNNDSSSSVVILQKPDTAAHADHDASAPPPPPSQAHKDYAVVEHEGSRPANVPIEESDDENASWKKEPETEGEEFEDPFKEEQPPKTLDHHECPDCDTVFTSLRDLDLHVLGKCTGVPRLRGSLRKKLRVQEKGSSVLSHKEKGKEKCDFCGKTFPWKSAMQKHMVCHSGKREFKCNLCDAEFFFSHRLKTHKKEVHVDGKPFLCAMCGSKYKNKGSLKRHHLIVHTDFKNHSEVFKCDLCDVKFFFFYRLKAHKKNVHFDGKPFVCATCGSEYKTNDSLKKHHISAHTDIRNFPCRQCGKPFSTSSNRNRHEKVHAVDKSFRCELCGKGFHEKNKLQVHTNWHLGVCPFECDVCHKKFLVKSNLTKHYRVHTGERPFVCSECGYGCVDSSQLKKHMLHRHDIHVTRRLTKGPERIDGALPSKCMKQQHATLGSSKAAAEEGEEKTDGSDESRAFTIATDALIVISQQLVECSAISI